MSIFIILVLCFVYFYCSALEAATEPMGDWESYDNCYDCNRRLLSRFRDSCGSRNWDLRKFK